MGLSGSDVARDAAAIILLDDDFASIVVAIREGRTLFDNLAKTMAYTLSHLWPEVIPILMNLAFSYPLAIGALQILIIDLGTELAPAISLAYEPSEDNVMMRPPRNVQTERLVSWRLLSYSYLQAGVIHTLLCFMSFWVVMNYYGFSPSALYLSALNFWATGNDPITTADGRTYNDSQQIDILSKAQTAYWATLVFGQVAHIFACKTRRSSVFKQGVFTNHNLIYGVVIEICLIFIVIFVPGVQYLFSTSPFPAQFGALVAFNMIALFTYAEATKLAARLYPDGIVKKYLIW